MTNNQDLSVSLSVNSGNTCNPMLGNIGDSVTKPQIEWLRKRCHDLLDEAERINRYGSPIGFLCIMAIIAYFAELKYGDASGIVSGQKTGMQKAEDNKSRFVKFVRDDLSNGKRSYSGISGPLYSQVRNGLAHCMMLFHNDGSNQIIGLSHAKCFKAITKKGIPCSLKKADVQGVGKVTVVNAFDMLEDLREAFKNMFNDQNVVKQMVEFSRTHPPIVGTKQYVFK